MPRTVKPSFKNLLKIAAKKRIAFGEKLNAFIETKFLNEKVVEKLGYTWEEGRGGNYFLVPTESVKAAASKEKKEKKTAKKNKKSRK